MKNFLTIAFLCSVALFQNCTSPDEQDVAPAPNLSTPAGTDLTQAVKKMEEFIMSGSHAILLKPVDSDPNTHLTTLYYANPKGGIVPILENFEVKQVETTTQGIYVLTNYSGIAFFVKKDHTWTELKNVGSFHGEDEKGNVIFSDGAVLKISNLEVDRSHLLPKDYQILLKSDNLLLVKDGTGTRKLVHLGTGKERDYKAICELSNSIYFVSLNNNTMALFSDCNGTSYYIMDMKSGVSTWVHSAIIYNPITIGRNRAGTGIISVGQYWKPEYNPGEVPTKLYTQVDFRYREGESGAIDPYQIYQIRNYEGNPCVINDRYSLCNAAVLNLSTISTYTVEGDNVYYSGTRNGKNVSGLYNLKTKLDLVVSDELFTSIQPLK